MQKARPVEKERRRGNVEKSRGNGGKRGREGWHLRKRDTEGEKVGKNWIGSGRERVGSLKERKVWKEGKGVEWRKERKKGGIDGKETRRERKRAKTRLEAVGKEKERVENSKERKFSVEGKRIEENK